MDSNPTRSAAADERRIRELEALVESLKESIRCILTDGAPDRAWDRAWEEARWQGLLDK